MIIFPIGIVISLVLYVYYKVAIVKSKDILTQKYFNGKSRICLGAFILLFGINQYFFYETTLSLIIGIIFVLLGGLQVTRGYNEARHYRNEYRRLNPSE
ncbi:YtpI family protein [Oceanobacillus luteolus]|uniref:YtpI family protein n=1 Tax=Oceanobacillus luteolus TaxID=1274358 RepID=A0ABW4HQF0_9BACI|nr:YtpI family protein [Oceanobacillus luteolus]MCM3741166.1 YtpI family protein [Oceanobacillus luteolus]